MAIKAVTKLPALVSPYRHSVVDYPFEENYESSMLE